MTQYKSDVEICVDHLFSPGNPQRRSSNQLTMAPDNPYFKSRYRVGTKILKLISGAWCKGTVTAYNNLSSWPYWISYDDGDSEEMNHKLDVLKKIIQYLLHFQRHF